MLLLFFLGLLCVLFLPPTCIATKRALRDFGELLEQISNNMTWYTLWVRRILGMGEKGGRYQQPKEEENGISMNQKAILAATADWEKSQGLTRKGKSCNATRQR
jgi:hypothetical protein